MGVSKKTQGQSGYDYASMYISQKFPFKYFLILSHFTHRMCVYVCVHSFVDLFKLIIMFALFIHIIFMQTHIQNTYNKYINRIQFSSSSIPFSSHHSLSPKRPFPYTHTHTHTYDIPSRLAHKFLICYFNSIFLSLSLARSSHLVSAHNIVAVMKMCDILHARHRSLWLRANWIFNLTDLAKQQMKLLGTIHGLTMKVIRNKKSAFKMGTRGSLARTEINTKGFGEGFAEFRTPDSVDDATATTIKAKPSATTSVEGLSFGQSSGLKDDLDVENEADDVGEKKRLAFLDLLLESAQNGALITDKEIKEQVDTIMCVCTGVFFLF